MTAGMPTPSYAAPHTASPGTRATSARIRATRSRWPTAYCGRPPPQRCTWLSTGRRGQSGGRAQVGQRGCDELLVGHLEHRLLAVTADRRAQQHESVAGLADPVPLGEGERRGLDRAPVDRRYEEAGAGQVGNLLGPEGQRSRSPSRRTRCRPARPTQQAPRSASRRAVGAAGVASTTSSASNLFGGRRRPDDQRETGRRTAKLAHRRARADVEPVRQSHREPAQATRDSGEHRAPVAASTVAAAASTSHDRCSTPPAAASVARAERLRAWPAYTPPSSGSTSRSTTSSPSRVATSSPTETSSPSATGWPLVSWRSRSTPASLSTPDAATWSRSAGTPITERGSGRSAPLVQTDDEEVAGWTTSSPSACASVDALGPARQHRLGPQVDPDSRDLADEQLAADAGRPLDDRYLATRGGQVASGGQAGDAGPDHDGAARRVGHAPSLSARSAGRGGRVRPVSKPRNQVDMPPVVRPCAPLASSRSRPPLCCSLSRPAPAGPTTSGRPPPKVVVMSVRTWMPAVRVTGRPAPPAEAAPADAGRAYDAGNDVKAVDLVTAAGADQDRSGRAAQRRRGPDAVRRPGAGRRARRPGRRRQDRDRQVGRAAPLADGPAGAGRRLRRGDGRPRTHGHPRLDHHQLGGRHHPAHRCRSTHQGSAGQCRAGASAADPRPVDPRHHGDRGRDRPAAGRARLARPAAGLPRGPDLDVDGQGQHRAHSPTPRRPRPRTTTPASSPDSPPAGTASSPPWWPPPPWSAPCSPSPSSCC